jgi:integrase
MPRKPSGKRQRGQGSFRTKGNREYFLFRPDGETKQKWFPIGDIGELNLKEREAKAREIMQTYKPPPKGVSVTYGEAFSQMISFKREVKERSEATLECYVSSNRCHFADWKNRDIRTITEREVEDRQAKIKRKLKPKSVNNHIGNCKAVFEHAVKKGWLDESPAKHVEPLDNPDPGKLKFMTVAELETLCKAVPADTLGFMEEIMYRVTFETGMRQGEVLALRWYDLDWSANKITIERANNGRTGERDGPTKNKKPRTVPMTRRLRDLFEELFRISHYKAPEDRIFCHPETGKLYDRSKCRKRLEACYLKSGVGGYVMKKNKAGKSYRKAVLTFHSLRHSFGSALAMGGRKAIEIKELMGHQSLAMTDKYMHFAPDLDQADQIGAVFEALRESV